MDYPKAEEELAMLQQITHESVADKLDLRGMQPVLSIENLMAIQQAASLVVVDAAVQKYVVSIVTATRAWNGIDIGAGPRGSISLLRAARAHALLHGNEFVTPDDVKNIAPAVLRHRIQLTPDLEIEGYSPDDVIANLLTTVEAPRQ